MTKPFYTDIFFSKANNAYLFQSIGKKGVINKIVIFQLLSRNNTYNLFLGDYNGPDDISDDLTISNNGGIVKVLTTVYRIVLNFSNKHKAITVIISGSDKTRKALYARIIRNNHHDFSSHFKIECILDEKEGFISFNPLNKSIIPIAFRIKKR
jgi:hypothetical protein